MQNIRRYWRIIFPIIIGLIIWHFSSQNGELSDKSSLHYAEIFGISNALVRKLAHVVLFALFAFATSSFIKGANSTIFPTRALAIYPIVATAIYAMIDEVHQLTVPGRSSQVSDIIIDILGATIGTLLYIAIFCFWRIFRFWLKSKQYSKQ